MDQAAANIFVIPSGRVWKVVCGGDSWSGFSTRRAAEGQARGLASSRRAEGRLARVFVEDGAGALALVEDGDDPPTEDS